VLKLRRGQVVGSDPLTVRVAGRERRAWADPGLVGEVRQGDEVIVNVEALDLGLGSGGFDVVHANLTRGLQEGGGAQDHVMKLNYTSLQHPVEPVEIPAEVGDWRPQRKPPLLVIFLHGQLAPAAWAVAAEAEGLRVGFVQTAGGALPGALSHDIAELRDRGLLTGHVTAAPCYGGEHEAISLTGALHAAADELGWDAIIAGPGPGILGSATRYGHGGMAALDSAHAGAALGMPVVIAPRLSAGDPRPRHRGLSHHTEAVLRLLLASVAVAAPLGAREVGARLREVCAGTHRVEEATADLDGYAQSGLPARTMGRSLQDDPLFFGAALAGGSLLAKAARAGSVDRPRAEGGAR
jgi:hypothetical protein